MQRTDLDDLRRIMENPEEGKKQIREWLRRDLRAAIYTMEDVIQTPEIFDIYVENFWRRQIAFYEKQRLQADQVEMPFNSNGKH